MSNIVVVVKEMSRDFLSVFSSVFLKYIQLAPTSLADYAAFGPLPCLSAARANLGKFLSGSHIFLGNLVADEFFCLFWPIPLRSALLHSSVRPRPV